MRPARTERMPAALALIARLMHVAGIAAAMERGTQTGAGMEPIEELIERSLASGAPLRLHVRGGEVLVAQVLAAGEGRLRCRVLTSSRPENHANCDSLGLELGLEDIAKAAPVSADRYRGR